MALQTRASSGQWREGWEGVMMSECPTAERTQDLLVDGGIGNESVIHERPDITSMAVSVTNIKGTYTWPSVGRGRAKVSAGITGEFF